MDSIEKLREFSRWFDGMYATENVGSEGTSHTIRNYPTVEGMGSVGDDMRGIADEIEREHAECLAELNDDLCDLYERRDTELKDALKAICKRFGVSSRWSAEDAAKKVLEALERDYMALPKDADGVPIHVGDKVTWVYGKPAAKFTIDTFAFDMEHGEWDVKDSNYLNIFPAHLCRHVKPRTLESVLADLANEVWEASCTCQTTWSDSGLDGIEKKYADEIRELMEAEE